MNSSNSHQRHAFTAETLQHLNAILRLKPVLAARGGISQSGHYADCASGLYTKPVKIGPRASGWPASEVAALNSARIAGKSDDEIRALVATLTAARAALA